MRRRLVLSTVAVVTVVIIVLLVPVLLIVRNAAESELQSRLDQQLGVDHRNGESRVRRSTSPPSTTSSPRATPPGSRPTAKRPPSGVDEIASPVDGLDDNARQARPSS